MSSDLPSLPAMDQVVRDLVRRSDGEIRPETVTKWAAQFEQEELPIVLKLIESLRFYSSSRVHAMVRQLHVNIQQAVEVSLERVWFVPVGYVAKSGSAIAFFYRKQNDLPTQRFVMAKDLTSSHFEDGSAVVFLDDFVGSGHQAVQFWWNGVVPILPDSCNCHFILGSLVGYESGIKHVEASTKLRVVALDVLGDSDRAFSAKSQIFQSATERDAALVMARKYGERLYPKYPAGYGNSQSLLGFFYSTPNNSLPIFWSAEGGWFPLLPRAEVIRDMADLLGPKPQEGTPSINPVPSEFDLDSIPEDVSSCLVREFKTLGIVNEVAKRFTRLGIQGGTFSKLFRVVDALKHFEHERVPVPSSLIVVPRDSPVCAEVFTVADGVDIDCVDKVLSIAQLVRGDCGALVVAADGCVRGNWLFPQTDMSLHFSIPTAARGAACASSYSQGAVLVFNGAGRVSLFHNGDRILVHRGSAWHRTGIDDRILASLSQRHDLRAPVVQGVLRIAFNLADSGAGALITVGDHEEVLRYSDKPATEHVRWREMSIEDTPLSALLPLFSQDGATIVTAKGIVAQGMTFLRPPAGVSAVEEVGKGSKHSTAAKVSKITRALVIAVSVDGRITVFSGGEHALKRMG